jgi:hypothetical protein
MSAVTVECRTNGEEAGTGKPVTAEQPSACSGPGRCDDQPKNLPIWRLNP